jgi:small redox-active disulfide protein 2
MSGKDGGVRIEILGTGCPKCNSLARHVKAAVDKLGIDADVLKVTDIVEIADRGVMMTPALSIDGEVKLVGRAGTPDEIRAMLAASIHVWVQIQAPAADVLRRGEESSAAGSSEDLTIFVDDLST